MDTAKEMAMDSQCAPTLIGNDEGNERRESFRAKKDDVDWWTTDQSLK